MNTREEIKESVERIKRELGGRAELLAAVKTVPPEYINYAIDCGVTLIGENRVSEVLEKYGRIDRTRAKLHFIGALKTNKVKYIIDKVDMIQSVDRESLASEIEKQAAKHGIIMPVLVEINIGGEESKSGIRPECALEFCKYLADLPHIRVSGLMAVPPKSGDQEKNAEYFRKMRKIFIDISAAKVHNVYMEILSLGMSGDYLTAVENGSTMVRIGSAIFGARPKANTEAEK